MTALAAALALALAAPDEVRVALLVSNDAGLDGEPALRHTAADAERLAAVLTELGGFAPERVILLRNRTGAEILDAVDALARAPAASTVLFYYSGHADAGALHPSRTLLPLDLLLHRLKGAGPGLRIAILDACQSGAATRAKGSRPSAPFSIRAGPADATGDILISSSAEDEQSFEGEHGGVFTVHLTAGLRGAADANGDGAVTLGEAYAYAYAQTLRATLAAGPGPQHARFRHELAGSRDPVLTRLARGAQLTLEPRSAGVYVVFDARERSVLAEVPSRAGEPRRLALAPGTYVVHQRAARELRVARVALAAGDDRTLPEHQMLPLPMLRLARKGASGQRRLTLGAGQAATGLGTSREGALAAGLEVEGARWVAAVNLALASGTQRHAGLRTDERRAVVTAELLASWRAGHGALRAGPLAGLALLRQVTEARPATLAAGGAVGGRLRADVGLTPSFGLHATADAGWLLLRVRDAPRGPGFRAGALGFVPWITASAGIRLAF